VRLFDLILALIVLWALVIVARHQYPAYDGKSYVPNAQAASPSPGSTP